MLKSRIFPWSLLLLGGVIGWTTSQVHWHHLVTAQDDAAVLKEAANDDATVATEAVDGASDRPLETLDWLVGDWTDNQDDPKIKFTCQFSKNNAFLIRSFKSKLGETDFSGMQVIAWDPAQQVIRSWTYDSNGGFGEDVWTQMDERYTLRTKYTLADGGIASALSVLNYVDEGTCTWQTVHREIDGVLQPSADEITLIKVTATPSEPATAQDNAGAQSDAAAQGDAATPGENQ
ncbi:hypothetical protein [Stieleria varia]|uniref:DUF1579 domain-containing protein n=1 Tax=Stieleria varia TaxID=2528005 RepID=A0A5C6AY27_9BACT|nr:hypothetical protein [Stieleria varia]TWU04351.1 hypothetical protein Pla52n_23910 [Stieleria varia]